MTATREPRQRAAFAPAPAAARIADQLRIYRQRRALFDRAAGQVMALSAVLLGFATAAAALAGTDVGPTWFWTALGTVLPAAVTAVTAYSKLYAFEQQSKIYEDAAKAVKRPRVPPGTMLPSCARPSRTLPRWSAGSKRCSAKSRRSGANSPRRSKFPMIRGRDAS